MPIGSGTPPVPTMRRMPNSTWALSYGLDPTLRPQGFFTTPRCIKISHGLSHFHLINLINTHVRDICPSLIFV